MSQETEDAKQGEVRLLPVRRRQVTLLVLSGEAERFWDSGITEEERMSATPSPTTNMDAR